MLRVRVVAERPGERFARLWWSFWSVVFIGWLLTELIGETGATVVVLVTLGLWAWCRLMAAGTRYAERREHETRS